MTRVPARSTLFPYTTLFRSFVGESHALLVDEAAIGQGFLYDQYGCEGLTWDTAGRSEEHTSELRHVAISYAVFCLKKKKTDRDDADVGGHSSVNAGPRQDNQ